MLNKMFPPFLFSRNLSKIDAIFFHKCVIEFAYEAI